MSLKLVAIVSALLLLCLTHVLAAATTVRPYKFGFTIDEQQHRAEKRDERGIVMGEFGFITADGIYHVTVYATDEEGKFRILSMKNYPYAGPVGQKTLPATTTPKALPLPVAPPKYNFNTEACSGCFLKKSPPKKEIRTLSQPLAPVEPDSATTAGISGLAANSPTGSAPSTSGGFPVGKSPGGSLSGKPQTGGAFGVGLSGGSKAPSSGGSPGGSAGATAGGSTGGSSGLAGGSAGGRSPGSGFGGVPAGGSKASGLGGSPTRGGAVGSGSGSAAGATGDLYKFKYILDYNGHEETGGRNGDKQGSYFAIGEDAVQRTIEYIANEFGFQPHISWRKLDAKEVLPEENSLKHYEFKWFNQEQ